VHRDLKPSNIMLSISRTPTASQDGFVRADDCVDCRERKTDDQELYLMPHIGDFGLVANIQDAASPDTASPPSPPLSPNTAIVPKTDNGSFLSRQVGTRFYCGPKLPKGKGVICPKLDVYSLGIIAFEMVYKFGTKSERNDVLEKLTNGEFPKGFDKHEMAEGIKKMLCHDRAERWSCADVRAWLQGFLGV
jgi:translation initiation factor 2-alpha kinase 3